MVSSDKTCFGLHIIASDILVRLECNNETQAQTWDEEDMAILNQRMEAIRFEIEEKSLDRPIKNRTAMNASNRYKSASALSSTVAADCDPKSEKFVLLRDFLLDALAFKAMNDREEQVTEAYSETFDWIYHETNHGFGTWLCSVDDASMYWIHGLPGSGKSTLMRYINQQSQTAEMLQKWAGDSPITLANFFFWESGTTAQRSQAGLLRSLLHQLLTQQPELIPAVFPGLWGKIWTADTRTRIQLTSTWSLSDLSDGFHRFFELRDSGRYICLLIDGLDEFEGDHQIIFDLLEHARQRPHTKICVSSRPWDVFQKAFRDIPALRLQDLTVNDMLQFVRGKLGEHKHIHQLMVTQPEAGAELVDVIVARADGVFLWVSLVVRTIVEKYQANHDLASVRRLVESLPKSLDDLFHYFLLAPTSNTRHKMSRIFQLIRAREVVCDFTRDDDSNLLHVWEMALTDDGIAALDTGAPIQEISENRVYDLCRQTIADISEHCAGLVEVHQTSIEKQRPAVQLKARRNNPFLARRKIMYLHRTVKDYLKQKEVWNAVVSHLPDIDAHLLHTRAVLFQFRFPIGAPRRQRNINEWWSRIVLAMTHARLCLPSSQQAMFDYLNAFDDTLNWYWPPRGGLVAIDSWARSCFGTYEERGSKQYPDPFLSLATKFGIKGYVETYLDTLEYEYEQGKPLLSYAVEYLIHRQHSVYPLSEPEIVDILLKNGENPNLIRQPDRDAIILRQNNEKAPKSDDEDHPAEAPKRKPPPALKTAWVAALEAVQQAHRKGWIEVYDISPEGTARWARILRAFLEHGADPDVVVAATYRDKAESALELLTRVFEAYRSREVQRVRELLMMKLG
ncbi:hypothetical protein CVT25_010024 [Psilocybe cyanescens]|uniref:Uncharacterized protein n=1 Tax=Psilocybe cyanescens TaxID=93625 RepID=A0A409X3C8_PSICY|nr:hypothetical protein CVT25_010024 [Psilocybe cyanescens]